MLTPLGLVLNVYQSSLILKYLVWLILDNYQFYKIKLVYLSN
jgi:hypothetical protein